MANGKSQGVKMHKLLFNSRRVTRLLGETVYRRTRCLAAKLLVFVFVCFIATSEVLAQGADSAKGSESMPWWQAIVGILGIPSAFLGLYLIWKQIRKTHEETENLRVERDQKEAAKANNETPRERGGHSHISVANGLVMENSTARDIKGIEINGNTDAPVLDQTVSVLNEGRLVDSSLRDIKGVDVKSDDRDEP
jgi:hypothetical protein